MVLKTQAPQLQFKVQAKPRPPSPFFSEEYNGSPSPVPATQTDSSPPANYPHSPAFLASPTPLATPSPTATPAPASQTPGSNETFSSSSAIPTPQRPRRQAAVVARDAIRVEGAEREDFVYLYPKVDAPEKAKEVLHFADPEPTRKDKARIKQFQLIRERSEISTTSKDGDKPVSVVWLAAACRISLAGGPSRRGRKRSR